jgi:quinoprotein glucose dehydrogenase
LWQVPFGEHQQLRRKGAPVKGLTNVGGAIVTAGGLVFATGTVDSKVRAFDSSTGNELWSFPLPAAGSAPPSTYQVDGAQYVVVVASARIPELKVDRFDKIVAFRLPAAQRH